MSSKHSLGGTQVVGGYLLNVSHLIFLIHNMFPLR